MTNKILSQAKLVRLNIIPTGVFRSSEQLWPILITFHMNSLRSGHF